MAGNNGCFFIDWVMRRLKVKLSKGNYLVFFFFTLMYKSGLGFWGTHVLCHGTCQS